jgi:hypothetical protein
VQQTVQAVTLTWSRQMPHKECSRQMLLLPPLPLVFSSGS